MIFIGKKQNGENMFYNGESDVIAIFANRTGFGSGIVVPTLYENEGNIVIIGKKRSSYTGIAKLSREKIGKVFTFSENTTKEELESILKERHFSIFMEIDYGKYFIEMTLEEKERLHQKVMMLIQSLKGMKCLLIVDEAPIFIEHIPNFLEICLENKNTRKIFRIQAEFQIKDLKIDVSPFTVVKRDLEAQENEKIPVLYEGEEYQFYNHYKY